MPKQPGFCSDDDSPSDLSVGDPLDRSSEVVDFELFRPCLSEARRATDRSRGGKATCDALLKLQIQYPQAQHGLSCEASEHLVRDQLSLRGLLAAFVPGIGSKGSRPPMGQHTYRSKASEDFISDRDKRSHIHRK